MDRWEGKKWEIQRGCEATQEIKQNQSAHILRIDTIRLQCQRTRNCHKHHKIGKTQQLPHWERRQRVTDPLPSALVLVIREDVKIAVSFEAHDTAVNLT